MQNLYFKVTLSKIYILQHAKLKWFLVIKQAVYKNDHRSGVFRRKY